MNAKTYNAPTISAGTITRTAVLLLALTNQILSACGKPVLPIERHRRTVGHRRHHHRGRAGGLVAEQQLHRRRNPGGQVPGGQEEPGQQVRPAALLSRSGGRPKGRIA